MKKLTDFLHKITRRQLLIAAVCCAAVICGVFFAKQLTFYRYNTKVTAYIIREERDDSLTLDSMPFRFSYEGQTIVLHYCRQLRNKNLILCASTLYGGGTMTQDLFESIPNYYLGSFAAIADRQNIDMDGDGEADAVYYASKTDIRSVQTNTSVTPWINDNRLVLEPGLDLARYLLLHYDGETLAGAEVTVTYADGTLETLTTDGEGYLKTVSVRAVREGITLTYYDAAKDKYYVTAYCPETTDFFSDAAYPLLLIFGLAAVVILYTAVFSRRRRSESAKRPYRSRIRRQPRSAFQAARWGCMLLAFPVLVWGGTLLGRWYEDITLPVLVCGKYNQEQLFGSACYYLSHLNQLITLPAAQILLWLACFLGSLVLFGRAWCGFLCPMGLVQELLQLLRKKLRIEGVPQREGQRNVLAAVKWTLVLLFLFACFAGADFCSFCPAVTLSPALNGFRTGIYAGGFVMLAAVAGSFFKDRFFCNICPFGLILGLFRRISLVRLKKDCTACTECGACYRACPMGIKEIYTGRDKADVTDINCILCGECVRHCPENNALRITFAGKEVYASSRERFLAAYRRALEEKEAKEGSGNGAE